MAQGKKTNSIKFEKLDNNFNPTGEIREFNSTVAGRMLNMKNCHWRLVEVAPQKKSHAEPIAPPITETVSTPKEVEETKVKLKDFPEKTKQQLEWIKGQKDITVLKEAMKIAKSPVVHNEIDRLIIQLSNATNKK